ncbi:MAG: metal ABC transporter permease, partial [Candidatus Neomarinimicrobiota bacterium]
GAIGLFHYIYRKRFLLISTNVVEAERRNISVRWWDFLFYASFGLIVTSSVAIAGVLLVFSYLIAPAVCAMLLSDKIKIRLVVGWTVGIMASLIGLYLSASLDFPTGAAMVCTLSLFVPLVALAKRMLRPRKIITPFPAGECEK